MKSFRHSLTLCSLIAVALFGLVPHAGLAAQPDKARAAESAKVQKGPATAEIGHNWEVLAHLEKWPHCKNLAEVKAAKRKGFKPAEIREEHGNALLTAGITRLLNLLIGTASTQAYDATHCRIGVGNGTTAVSASDTDLSAAAGSTNRWFQLVSGAPTVSTNTVTFTAAFASADGNFAWNEYGIDLGTASGNTVSAPLLNRKVPASSLGTKASGSTWTFSVTITIT